MRRIELLLAVLVLAAGCKDPTQPGRGNVATQPSFDGNDAVVVRVARPTGDPATDVANIEAAVAAATPGAVIQFARGTYVIEATTQILVSVHGVTLQGHRQGTTIRGVKGSAGFFAGHFRLTGGNQTVRRLAFEEFRRALTIGEPGTLVGGYRVENSTFRNGHIPISFVAFSDDVSTIQDNEFINVTQPFGIAGKTVHFRGNRITAPDPTAAPFGQPFNAGLILPEFFSGIGVSENNVFEENTIIGNADGFIMVADVGEICHNNVIRQNMFIGQRVFTSEDNGTMVWLSGPGVDRNLIENNVLQGSEGLGIIVFEGSRNQIVENKFRDLPGQKETLAPFPGTAILLSEGTSGNQVRRNEFENVVNTIVDLGTRNIIGPGQGNENFAAASAARLSVTAKAQRMLDHPKLRVLRDRMKN
jgi:parallel beta-helix repeat protein